MDTVDKCEYCKKETAIECLECGRWFCNCLTAGKAHIISHMVRSRHKSAAILGRALECAICHENNLFRLGLADSECDSVLTGCDSVLTGCNTSDCDLAAQLRRLTLSGANMKSDEEMDEQQKLIKALGGLQGVFPNIFCGRCKDLPRIVGKEKFISFYPSGESSIEVKNPKDHGATPRPRLVFTPSSYLETFLPLISAEADKEKEIKEGMKQENMTLNIDGTYCKFTIVRNTGDFRVSVGDEVEFSHKGKMLFTGHVCEEQINDMVKVRIDTETTLDEPLEALPRSGYTVEFVWNPTTYKRMKKALLQLYEQRETNVIFKSILRGSKETMKEIEVLQPPGLFELNDSQRIAVQAALTRTLTLIQGPPGTGKTFVSALIVYNLVKHFNKRVMVVAPSNTAADQLAIKINSTGLKVLRIMSKRREGISSDVDFLCLHKLTNQFSYFERPEAQNKFLKMADVVCCTCVTAGQKVLQGLDFGFVLIDEAVQSTEPLSLIPCVFNPEKLILVGDHKQLGPTILNKEVVKHGFKQSLFERLLKIGTMPYLLSVQYRMHPDLCAFPSEYFYSGLLKSGTSTNKVIDLPNNIFYICDGKEEISQSRTSFFNKNEAAIVENVIRHLFKNGVVEQQIGVITPYEGQRSYILSKIFGNEAGNLEIKNVDGFQGREKDFIIVSLVRSNEFQGIGFVGDKRRMNVTLTRAKHGLIIVGNPFSLYKNPLWADLLNWYDERGLVYEGPLNALRRVSLKVLNLKTDSKGEAEARRSEA